MARYAMVHDASGIVVNVVEWDGNEEMWRADDGYSMVPDEPPSAGPGFTYANGVFTPPPSGGPGPAAKPAPEPTPQ